MYIEIKNNKLLSWCENPYMDYTFVDIDYSTFNPDEYTVENNILVNISNIEEYKAAQAITRQLKFESNFFEITGYGWYRKVPKGYSSAIESLNTVFNAVSVLGSLPANYLIFYAKPDFTDEAQCTEEWLIANSFKNTEMTLEQFTLFYQTAITIWHTQEHQLC